MEEVPNILGWGQTTKHKRVASFGRLVKLLFLRILVELNLTILVETKTVLPFLMKIGLTGQVTQMRLAY